MKSQLSLFDADQAKADKEAGMQQAAEHRMGVLEAAQEIALELGRIHSAGVHIDMVQRRLIAAGYHPSELGNAAGSVFKGDQWEFTGHWHKSARISNHHRDTKIWRLKGNAA